eukprot:975449-Pleurochrysis_carterae.AAC.2
MSTCKCIPTQSVHARKRTLCPVHAALQMFICASRPWLDGLTRLVFRYGETLHARGAAPASRMWRPLHARWMPAFVAAPLSAAVVECVEATLLLRGSKLDAAQRLTIGGSQMRQDRVACDSDGARECRDGAEARLRLCATQEGLEWTEASWRAQSAARARWLAAMVDAYDEEDRRSYRGKARAAASESAENTPKASQRSPHHLAGSHAVVIISGGSDPPHLMPQTPPPYCGCA